MIPRMVVIIFNLVLVICCELFYEFWDPEIGGEK